MSSLLDKIVAKLPTKYHYLFPVIAEATNGLLNTAWLKVKSPDAVRLKIKSRGQSFVYCVMCGVKCIM